MGRRVQEAPPDRSTDVRVAVPLTRREVRLAETQQRGQAERVSTSGGSAREKAARPRKAASTARLVDPVYVRRGTSLVRKMSWQKRLGSTVVIGGLAAGGLWALGGSIAQAKVVSAGTLQLSPGHAAVADSGLTFTNGQATASFDIPGQVAGGGVYVGLQTRSRSGAT